MPPSCKIRKSLHLLCCLLVQPFLPDSTPYHQRQLFAHAIDSTIRSQKALPNPKTQENLLLSKFQLNHPKPEIVKTLESATHAKPREPQQLKPKATETESNPYQEVLKAPPKGHLTPQSVKTYTVSLQKPKKILKTQIIVKAPLEAGLKPAQIPCTTLET